MTGDHESTVDEYQRHLEPILDAAYRTAYHLTGNAHDAEDLVQETALQGFRGFRHYQRGTNFRAWFLTVLRNQFISDYRKRQRTVKTVSVDDSPDLYLYTKTRDAGLLAESAEPARRLVERLDAQRVGEAINALPPAFREVATLYFTHDLSYQEIADILQIPVGTVRSRLHRGRHQLQHALWDLALEYGIVSADQQKEE